MLVTLVYDLLIILAAGLLAALVCRWLRISVLVGYLVVGTIVGEGVFDWVGDEHHELEHIAEVGVFLLLFSIGLEFSLDELVHLGRHLVIGGSIQMLMVAGPVVVLLVGLGFTWQSAILIASATSFSSTVLVFKALSEWGHSNLPHGRRAIGILLFQDAALVPLLLVIPLLTGQGEMVGPAKYLILAATSLAFIVAVVVLRIVLARQIIPLFASYRSPELIVLFTLVSLGGVTLAASVAGLPPAIGAFAAGLIFSGNRWSKQIDALVLPFRESFAAVFFVSLGLLFDPRFLWNEPWTMASCLVGLIGLKFIAAFVALWLTGLGWQAAAGMGIGLAHIGEFAFVLVLLGFGSGLIGDDTYQRVISLAIGSLILTPLLLRTGLHWIRASGGTAGATAEAALMPKKGRQAVVIGAGLIGRQMTSRLETAGNDVCLIDLSPVNLHGFAQQGFRTVAGDATDTGVLQLAGADQATVVVVCVPDDQAAIRIVERLRSLNEENSILVRCRYEGNRQTLTKAGADRVVSEEAQASAALLQMLNEFESGN